MSLGEFDIIARYFTRSSQRPDVLLGVGDDAAVLEPPPDRKLVIAMDTIVEGVHFPIGINAADIGYRALAVNLSDLAAMGAEPAWMTLSLCLPQANEQWLSDFSAGLFELADRYGVELIGGDTVRGPLVITVQVGGAVESDRWLKRSGAQAGDLLYVSGTPGEAAAGLATIQRGIDGGAAGASLRRRFLRPEPRVELGRRLRRIASAAMDVSDGLLTDAGKLCTASGCGAVINVDALPASSAMSTLFAADACINHQLAGGDDYEIIFAISPERERELDLLSRSDVAVTRIGELTAGPGIQCVRNGRPFRANRGGYDHFVSSEDAR